MIARLNCLLFGHKKGKFQSLIRAQDSEKVIARMFICPRCSSTWTRKVKAQKASNAAA